MATSCRASATRAVHLIARPAAMLLWTDQCASVFSARTRFCSIAQSRRLYIQLIASVSAMTNAGRGLTPKGYCRAQAQAYASGAGLQIVLVTLSPGIAATSGAAPSAAKGFVARKTSGTG